MQRNTTGALRRPTRTTRDNIMAIVDTPLAGKADAESLLLYRKITGN